MHQRDRATFELIGVYTHRKPRKIFHCRLCARGRLLASSAPCILSSRASAVALLFFAPFPRVFSKRTNRAFFLITFSWWFQKLSPALAGRPVRLRRAAGGGARAAPATSSSVARKAAAELRRGASASSSVVLRRPRRGGGRGGGAVRRRRHGRRREPRELAERLDVERVEPFGVRVELGRRRRAFHVGHHAGPPTPTTPQPPHHRRVVVAHAPSSPCEPHPTPPHTTPIPQPRAPRQWAGRRRVGACSKLAMRATPHAPRPSPTPRQPQEPPPPLHATTTRGRRLRPSTTRATS